MSAAQRRRQPSKAAIVAAEARRDQPPARAADRCSDRRRGQAGPAQLLDHQLAHLAGAEQQAPVAPRSPWTSRASCDRGRGQRHRPLADAPSRCARAWPRRRPPAAASRARARSMPAPARARCASLTWPSTCGSPSTWLSSADATAKTGAAPRPRCSARPAHATIGRNRRRARCQHRPSTASSRSSDRRAAPGSRSGRRSTARSPGRCRRGAAPARDIGMLGFGDEQRVAQGRRALR